MTETKLEAYVGQVLPADRRMELLKSLPSYIKPQVFERNLLNAIMANPKLLSYDARLVYREVSKAASIGVLLDPILGEAYLVPGKDGVQLRIGYKGLMKLARISLGGALIYAHEVCANDVYAVRLGLDKDLVHEPNVFGERGDVIGYYAVIKYHSGESDFECMSVAAVHKIRDRSDGWNSFKKGFIKSTPWDTDEVEMGKKTVIRRLMKRQPQSPELAQAFAIEDAAEFPQFEKRPPGRPPGRPIKAYRGEPDDGSLCSQGLVQQQIEAPPPPPEDDDFPGDAHTSDDVPEQDEAIS